MPALRNRPARCHTSGGASCATPHDTAADPTNGTACRRDCRVWLWSPSRDETRDRGLDRKGQGAGPGAWARTRPALCHHTGSGPVVRLALFGVLASFVLPLATAQFCPYLRNSGEVYGKEDEPLNMQSAWMNSPGADRQTAGRLWHGQCPSSVCGSCSEDGSLKALAGQEKAGQDQIRIQYSVQYGRLYLRQGYETCNLVVNNDNFVESVNQSTSFFVTGTYDVVNCTLQFLTFQGLRFANKMTQLANFGKQPRVTVHVGPPRSGGPTAEGLNFIFPADSATFVIMNEVNTLPSLGPPGGAGMTEDSQGNICPTMGIENDRPDTGNLFPEQYENTNFSSLYDAVLPGLLFWDASKGGSRCLHTPLPGANRLLYPAPVPNFVTTNNVGQRILALQPKGSDIHPTKIDPSFCQNIETRIRDPPFCDDLKKVGHFSCNADPTSYVYHIEDYEDATMRLNGVRMWDKDLWTAHVDTTFSLRFEALGDGSSKLNDPFTDSWGEPMATQGPGIFTAFCAEPFYDEGKRESQKNTDQLDSNFGVWDKYCARTRDDAISGIVMFDKAETQIFVLTTADRTAVTDFDKTNCQMVQCLMPDCDPTVEAQKQENKWMCSNVVNEGGATECMVVGYVSKIACVRGSDQKCTCKSQVHAPTDVNGQETWEMILFWELADRDNRGITYEKGYMTLKYTRSSIISGTMWADPQTLPYRDYVDGNGLPFDWFRASPFKLKGKITTSDAISFYIDASTKPIVNPRFTMSLNSIYGNISLPNTPTHLVPVDKTRTKIKIVGTMNELNEALSVLEYRVPGAVMPHFNTLSRNHSIYGRVEEKLVLTMDDGGNSGVISNAESTTFTTMEFNLVVIADNDAPELYGPSRYDNIEFRWFALNELRMHDLDAPDRLLPGETITGPGQILVTEIQVRLSASFGKFRIDTNTSKRVSLLVPVPGSIRPFPGEPEPCVTECTEKMVLRTYAEFMAIGSKVCRDCLQDYAKVRVSTEGHSVVEFEGDLDDCNMALQRAWYRGDAGYSKLTPSTGDPFTILGEQTSAFGDSKALEYIVVTARDLGNTGCTSVGSKITEKRISVVLDDVEDDPFLQFVQDDQDMCNVCKHTGTCDVYCPNGVPKVYTFETLVLAFNQSFGPQIRDYDTRATSFLPARYTLRLTVQQGILLLPREVVVDGANEVVSGLTYTKGTEGCRQCNEFQLSGEMFQLNLILMGLQYVPIKFYNSEFGSPEHLDIQLTQNDPVPSTRRIAFSVILFVQSVNDVPALNLFAPGSTSTKISVGAEFHDFIFLGGREDRSQHCSGKQVTCLTLQDPDACEAMYLATGTLPEAKDTVLVQSSTAPICLDTKLDAGKIRLTVTCNFGNLWFFSPSEIKQWPPDLSLVPLVDPGKEKRTITLDRALSQYAGGILRYYASEDYSTADTITIEVDDHGNTGRARLDDPTFCCCTDAVCRSCDRRLAACSYNVQVSSCATVEGWVCKDVEGKTGGLPGVVVTVMVTIAGLFVTSAGAWVVYQGHMTNSVSEIFRVKDVEVVVEKVSISKFVDNPPADLAELVAI